MILMIANIIIFEINSKEDTMNKKGIILLAVLMIAGGAAFASGQQDVNEDGGAD